MLHSSCLTLTPTPFLVLSLKRTASLVHISVKHCCAGTSYTARYQKVDALHHAIRAVVYRASQPLYSSAHATGM